MAASDRMLAGRTWEMLRKGIPYNFAGGLEPLPDNYQSPPELWAAWKKTNKRVPDLKVKVKSRE